MNYPDETPPSEEITRTARARRRRARRALMLGEGERAVLLERLARRAFPSLDFFILSLLCGAVLGAGYLINSQGLLLFGVLLAPLLTPWIGLTLATVNGALRYFLSTIIGISMSGALIFAAGYLAGLAANLWFPPMSQAILHSRLWWADLFVLIVGAVLLVVSFVRSEERPVLPSVMLAYELLPPISAAGYGLGRNVPDVWPEGLLIFLFYFCLATLVGVVTLLILRFRPVRAGGYLMTFFIVAACLIAVIMLSGLANFIFSIHAAPAATPTSIPLPSITPSVFHAIATVSITATSVVTGNLPTLGISPNDVPTATATPEPTPVYAQVIVGGEYPGANVREGPGFDARLITGLPNGTQVYLLPETEIISGLIWIHVYVPSLERDGWMLQSVLATNTPTPN